MNLILQKFKQIDQFGAVYKPSVHHDAAEYRSVGGGIATLLIYGLSAAYFLYYVYLWWTNQLLPKITNAGSRETELELSIPGYVASFYMRIDPLDPKALILQPVMHVFVNNFRTKSYPLEIALIEDQYQVDVQNLNFILSLDTSSPQNSLDYLITFGNCQDHFLLPEYECASAEKVDQYFRQPVNALAFHTFIQQFNPQKLLVEEISRDYYTLIDEDSTFFSQNLLQLETVNVDTGFLMQSEDSFQYVSYVETMTQQLSSSYFQKIFGYKVHLAFMYKLGSVQNHAWIEYPKISEVLADIGSIVSLIWFFSYITLFINERFLDEQAILSVIAMYYPEYKGLYLKKNLFGKVKAITLKGQEQDLTKFIEYYKQLRRTAVKKLSVSNQIYELSRLQFLVHSLVSRNDMSSIHRVGIKFQRFPSQPQNLMNQSSDQTKHDYQNISNMQIAQNKSFVGQELLQRQMQMQLQIEENPCSSDEIIVSESNDHLPEVESRKSQLQHSQVHPPATQQRQQAQLVQINEILSDQDFGLLCLNSEQLAGGQILNVFLKSNQID